MDTSLLARGGTPVELDRTRILFFDLAATWLLIQRYGMTFATQLYRASGKGDAASLELVSIDALAFFLFVGLMAEARANGETLTEEFVQQHIVPFNVQTIFLQVAIALSRSNRVPAPPTPEGKAEAAPAGPAEAAAKQGRRKPSTSTKRSASRTASLGKRRKGSSRRR